jgi:MYXO-CTERM domain-containing protein
MTRKILSRRFVRVLGVVLALATAAGPASARTFDLNSQCSLVHYPTPPGTTTTATASARTTTASGHDGIEWGYIAIGSSAAALALIGVGAAATGRRRSREDRSRRATIAG